jgi:hypothetical protein
MFAKHGSRTSGPDQNLAPFAFRPSTAHDERQWENRASAAEGRVSGAPFTVPLYLASGKLLFSAISVTGLSDKWTSALANGSADTALLEIQQLPFSRPITREPIPASSKGRPELAHTDKE